MRAVQSLHFTRRNGTGRRVSGPGVQGGFTLIEILVAVAVVAFALSALLSNMMKHIDGTAYLREKTFANWVALNRLEEAQIDRRINNRILEGSDTGRAEMADRQWYWEVKAIPSESKKLIRLEIRVYADEAMATQPLAVQDGVIDGQF